MGNSAIKAIDATGLIKEPSVNAASKPKCKACCACPETKKARDECIMQRVEDNCGDLIEKHKQCMRDMGFKV